MKVSRMLLFCISSVGLACRSYPQPSQICTHQTPHFRPHAIWEFSIIFVRSRGAAGKYRISFIFRRLYKRNIRSSLGGGLGVTVTALECPFGGQMSAQNGPLGKHRREVLAGLLIADDVVFLAESFSMLHKQFKHLTRWSKLWGPRFGIHKCGFMEILPEGQTSPTRKPIVRLSGTPVPWVSSYLYLAT